MIKERVQWIDVAKFLGIFAIYIGHIGGAAIPISLFVFYYHVPLFFFLSGCMSNYDKETNYGKFVLKKLKSILIPFFLFSFLALFVEVLYKGLPHESVTGYLLLISQGNIRNTFFAASLWFLSCLFVVELVFKLIKYLKHKWLILLLCIIVYFFTVLVVMTKLAPVPSWPYNFDSALYYLIFYAIGYIAYPYILELFKLDSKKKRGIFIATGIVSAAYAIALFFGIDVITQAFGDIKVMEHIIPLLRIPLLIWVNLCAAKLFEKIDIFKEIGQNTLYLCGNEYIITTLLANILGMFSFGVNIITPLTGFIYASILILVGIKLVIPFEKAIVNSFKQAFCK